MIGTPVANRPRQELAPLIGFFANTLALRITLEGDPTFEEALEQVKGVALDAFDRQHLPFDLLVDDMNPPRSLSLAPIFQIMFSLQDTNESAALTLPEIRAEAIVPDAVNAKFDLSLNLFETPDGMVASWDYSRELFDQTTIASLGASFETLLEGIVADPKQRIGQLPLLDAAGKAHVLALGRGVTHAWPQDACLHTLVEQQVARRPEAPAAVWEGGTWSYAQLNGRANRLAHHLRRLGVGPDVPVAIAMARSPELLVGVLAILKAGGAYVPIEPDYPIPRLQYLIADSAPRLVLCDGGTVVAVREALDAQEAGAFAPAVIDVDADATAWAHENENDPCTTEMGLQPSHLAYIIYTSGSTGQPKGAMNTHRGVANRLLWLQACYPHDSTDRVLFKTPVGFDVSVREIFLSLLSGACIVLARPDGHKDPSYLIDLIVREQVTVASFVPSMLQAFLEHRRANDCRSLRRIFSGGEALSSALARVCREALPRAGRTTSTAPPKPPSASPPGTARKTSCPRRYPSASQARNTRIYILDAAGRPTPRGMRGEIHIAGVQLARGYLKRPELTAERFRPIHSTPPRERACTAVATWAGSWQTAASNTSAETISRSRSAVSAGAR